MNKLGYVALTTGTGAAGAAFIATDCVGGVGIYFALFAGFRKIANQSVNVAFLKNLAIVSGIVIGSAAAIGGLAGAVFGLATMKKLW